MKYEVVYQSIGTESHYPFKLSLPLSGSYTSFLYQFRAGMHDAPFYDYNSYVSSMKHIDHNFNYH